MGDLGASAGWADGATEDTQKKCLSRVPYFALFYVILRTTARNKASKYGSRLFLTERVWDTIPPRKCQILAEILFDDGILLVLQSKTTITILLPPPDMQMLVVGFRIMLDAAEHSMSRQKLIALEIKN